MNKLAFPLSILLLLTLAACTQPSAPSQIATKPSLPPDHDVVAAIRAAGTGMDSAVQVQPLRDPAIEGLLKQAHDAEVAKNYTTAADFAAKALKLAPNAPDIIQYQAEIAAARGNWKEAEDFAIASYKLGPKVGSLCARNWQTVVEARTALNDSATVTQAKQRLKECRVAAPVRM
ncbi:MAG: tetratricopeptide repeat protein [Rhodanobacteraceae bacterium]